MSSTKNVTAAFDCGTLKLGSAEPAVCEPPGPDAFDCESIKVFDLEVQDGGAADMTAKTSVVFHDGLAIQAGGALTVTIDGSKDCRSEERGRRRLAGPVPAPSSGVLKMHDLHDGFTETEGGCRG